MGVLSGTEYSIHAVGSSGFKRVYDFIRQICEQAHGLSQMEENISHVVLVEHGDTILGAGSYAPAGAGIRTVFDVGAAHLLRAGHPLLAAPREKIAEWDTIALLSKEDMRNHLQGDISEIRKALVDIIYAIIFNHAASTHIDFVTMIGSCKVGECCERAGVLAEYLGRADQEAIKKAFPLDSWDRLFGAYPRECFVADLRRRHSATCVVTQSVIYNSGCSLRA